MFDNTGSHCKGVGFMVPEMSLMVVFNWVSTAVVSLNSVNSCKFYYSFTKSEKGKSYYKMAEI